MRKIIRRRSTIVVNRISPYIKYSKKVIDIGSGTGDVAYVLRKKGKKVIPVDVGDFHGPRLMQENVL